MRITRRDWRVAGVMLAIALPGMIYWVVQAERHSKYTPVHSKLTPQEESLKAVLNATELFCARNGRPPNDLDELRSSDARFATELGAEKLSVLRGGMMFTPRFLALRSAIPDKEIVVAAELGESDDSGVWVILANGWTRDFSLSTLHRQIGLLQDKLEEMKPASAPSGAAPG